MRLGQITGSFGTIANGQDPGAIRDNLTALASGSIAVSSLSGSLSYMASAIRRIAGGPDFSINERGHYGGSALVADYNFHVTGSNFAASKEFTIHTDAGDLILESDAGSAHLLANEASVRDAIILNSLGAGSGIQIKVPDADGIAIIGNDSADTYVKVTTHGTPANEKIELVNLAGSAAGAIALTASAGGVSITGAAEDVAISATASGKDVNITASGGGTQVISLASAGTGTDAIKLNATAGGIDIDSDGGPIVITSQDTFGISLTTVGDVGDIVMDSGDALTVTADKKITYTSQDSNVFDSIKFASTTGGVFVDPTTMLSLSGANIRLDAKDAGSIGIGTSVDGLSDTSSINIGTSATARTITVGAIESTSVTAKAIVVDIDGGATGVTIDALDAGSIDIGVSANAASDTSAINIGTSATARTIKVGANESTEVELNAILVDINAGTGGFTIDGGAASTIDTSAGDISIDSAAGSVQIRAAEAVADAIVLDAESASGGIDLSVNSTVVVSVDANSVDIAQSVDIADTTTSTSVSTGALVVDGGVGIAENLYVGGVSSFTGQADFAGEVVIGGNLQVQGSTTTVSSSNLTVQDSIIGLGVSGSSDPAGGTWNNLGDRGFIFAKSANAFDAQGGLWYDGTNINFAKSLTSPTSMSFATPAGTDYLPLIAGNLLPGGVAGTNDYNIGSATKEWNDIFLNDSSVINFGLDQDTTLTHTDGSGLAINGTNKLGFGGSFADSIQLDTNLKIAATADIVLNPGGANVVPGSDDGAALGASGTAFSDLFVADGAFVDWAGGSAASATDGASINWTDAKNLIVSGAGPDGHLTLGTQQKRTIYGWAAAAGQTDRYTDLVDLQASGSSIGKLIHHEYQLGASHGSWLALSASLPGSSILLGTNGSLGGGNGTIELVDQSKLLGSLIIDSTGAKPNLTYKTSQMFGGKGLKLMALATNTEEMAISGSGGVKWIELKGNNKHGVGFKAPNDVAADVIWALPNAEGAANTVLTTNGAGELSWSAVESASAQVVSGSITGALGSVAKGAKLGATYTQFRLTIDASISDSERGARLSSYVNGQLLISGSSVETTNGTSDFNLADVPAVAAVGATCTIELNVSNTIQGETLTIQRNGDTAFTAAEPANWSKGGSAPASATALAAYIDTLVGLSAAAVDRTVTVTQDEGGVFGGTIGISSNGNQNQYILGGASPGADGNFSGGVNAVDKYTTPKFGFDLEIDDVVQIIIR